MKTNTDTTITEEVRAAKKANKAEHDFDVAHVIAASKARQETSGRQIIPNNAAGNKASLAMKASAST